MRFLLASAVCLAAVGEPAVAQRLVHKGEPEGEVSALLTVSTTDPVLYRCTDEWESCFRVYVQVSALSDRPVKVASVKRHSTDNDGRMYATSALSGTGATCAGYVTSSFPSSGTFNEWVRFLDVPYTVTRSKAGAFMMTFGCDGKLVVGDELTIQLAIAADPDGRGPRIANYFLNGLKVAAPR